MNEGNNPHLCSTLGALEWVNHQKGKPPDSSAIIRILGDSREFYPAPVLTTTSSALLVDIDISGTSQLTRISEDAWMGLDENKNCDEHVSWGDPKVG